ncbi:hypothetical protein PG995_010197 [Apiospora arundinis]|uniref:Uncharacterized protein n=1 Tax=Apiospora arundinis TaxID=335852 RepID=A0ABR2ISY9_9PEZI
MQELANATPEDTGTGTGTRPWADDLKKAQREEATPRTHRKWGSLMVFIGKYITLQDYISNCGFMDGKSRSAFLTKSLDRVQETLQTPEGYSFPESFLKKKKQNAIKVVWWWGGD